MKSKQIRVYAGGFPESESYKALFSRPELKAKCLTAEEIFKQSDPEPDAVFVIYGADFDDKLIAYLDYFDKKGKKQPIVIVGENYDQNYIEKMFVSRYFTYLKQPCSVEELFKAIVQAADGKTAYIPHHDYEKELQTAKDNIDALHEIGMALSSENDMDKLLEQILTQSRNIAEADAGSLYLVEGEDSLRFKLSQNISRDWSFKQNALMPISTASIGGHAALSKEAVNLLDAYSIPQTFAFTFNKKYDNESGYRTKSMLTVPMINKAGEVIGVIQLINKRADYETRIPGKSLDEKQIIPFAQEDIELLSSLASQAAVALENTRLYLDIKMLFEGFVKASIVAIEARDPSTHGHSERVAELTLAMAEEINKITEGPLADLKFDQKHLTELRYAALLHDFGKVGVREEILVKAKKLQPGEFEVLKERYKYIEKSIEADFFKECLDYTLENGIEQFMVVKPSLEAAFSQKINELREILELLIKSNEPTVLEEGNFHRLIDIAKKQHVDRNGFMTPYLTERETHVLSIKRGSLSESERIEIESHVRHTFNFLSKIPWTKDLNRIPEIAYAHHEKLNGRGYPNHLMAADIPVESQMMCIADIFDALTAQDRPYKPAVPLAKAINILQMDVSSDHINKELVDLFVGHEIYKVLEGKMFR